MSTFKFTDENNNIIFSLEKYNLYDIERISNNFVAIIELYKSSQYTIEQRLRLTNLYVNYKGYDYDYTDNNNIIIYLDYKFKDKKVNSLTMFTDNKFELDIEYNNRRYTTIKEFKDLENIKLEDYIC